MEHPAHHPGDRAKHRCAVDFANYFPGLNPVADGAQSMKTGAARRPQHSRQSVPRHGLNTRISNRLNLIDRPAEVHHNKAGQLRKWQGSWRRTRTSCTARHLAS